MTSRIDAHVHLWDLQVRDQPWLARDSPIRRSFGVLDLRKAIDRTGVGSCVLVQVLNRTDETEELLRLAVRQPFVIGVVGWADLTSTRVGDEVRRLAELGPLVGVRHQVQAESDPTAWLLRDDVSENLTSLSDADLCLDLMIRPAQFAAARELVRRHPRITFVVDHCGKPPIGSELQMWRDDLAELAALPNVACKLSGLVNEVRTGTWHIDHLRPVADAVLEMFGPGRTMFGSDWPVCLQAASYGQVVDAVELLLAALDPADQLAVWGGTALRVYSADITETG